MEKLHFHPDLLEPMSARERANAHARYGVVLLLAFGIFYANL
jgi:hypothetical protein